VSLSGVVPGLSGAFCESMLLTTFMKFSTFRFTVALSTFRCYSMLMPVSLQLRRRDYMARPDAR